MGSDVIPHQQGDAAQVGRHAVDAGEVQVKLRLLRHSGVGVGEIDGAVGLRHHVVGAVQRAALKAVGDHGKAAVGFLAGYAAPVVFGGEQAALGVAGQAVGAVGGFAEQRQALGVGPFHPPVVMNVAEQQIAAFLPPDRPLGRTQFAAEAAGQFVDGLRWGNDPLQGGVVRYDGHKSPRAFYDFGAPTLTLPLRGRECRGPAP